MRVDVSTKPGRRLLAVAARRVIRQQVGFPSDLARHMQLDRADACALLEALAVLEVVDRPGQGEASWPVRIRAERAEEIYAAILEGPNE